MIVRRAGCTKCAGSVQYLAEETGVLMEVCTLATTK